MTTADTDFEIFLAGPPGLESVLCEETRLKGFKRPAVVPGGVVTRGGWPEVWRANLWIRGASRVLARVDSFPAVHLAELERRARRVAWASVLRPDVSFRVEAVCLGSRIYHEGAAAERIETAIKSALGAQVSPVAEVVVRLRIERNMCVLSVDTSGELLHRRGYKQAVNRAPLRETLAALFLRQCRFDGVEPVVDPMCGSGTFVIEAAEIAARLNPGRARNFAFERLATFDEEAWRAMRAPKGVRTPTARYYGRDRDAGAIAMSCENAERSGVTAFTDFRCAVISEAAPPDGPPGLVMINPPYGARIGDKGELAPLYGALGKILMQRFSGWRVGLVANDSGLAHATGLPFLPNDAPVPHGGLRVTLFQTDPLR
ncbi:class I SAM-dependent RNA methyltransferase [Acetobacter sacchari]|uniref:Class I SAM-dependent RNA methyltransferase n=1 Tax=Acetobacter sacchari TaxID=2661687 RepID=A0ABS3LY98_9PROT|nr:class I SAM-dependent RNA methyltransferase [Acetobacter sacchari]MBO1360896.1 class I SAM-dependent RNA methyltransferase [Acetobacter sacchari]